MIANVTRRRRVTTLAMAAALVMAAAAMAPFVVSAAHLLDLSGYDGVARVLLPVRTRSVDREDLSIPTRYGPVGARRYTPTGRPTHYLMVVPGIQAGGVDEPRLATFAARLAGTGALVVTVPLPDLRVFRVTPRSTDMIEDAVRWMSSRPELAPEGRIGLVGISFAGGLAIVAAGRPGLEDRLTMVVAIGSHGDLPRVMSYLCGGLTADARRPPPHDYGVAIIALAAADRLVPPDQVDDFSDTVLTFLRASSLASIEPASSDRLFETARTRAASLPDPARQLAGWVNARDVGALGPRLLPFIEALGGDPALSPSRSPIPRVPVFLLHGPDDTVIPSTELDLLRADLEARGNTDVRALLTPILRHADLRDRISLGDAWALVRFWTALRLAG